MDIILDSIHSYLFNFNYLRVLELIMIFTGVIGYHFIAKQNKKGFYIWIVGNFFSIWFFIEKESYFLVFLYLYNTYLSVVGIRHWRDKETVKLVECICPECKNKHSTP